MERWFNTAGPNKVELHYTLPVMRRLPSVRRLIDQQSYFVLHAPRQVGKTTSFLSLAQELTAQGRYTSALLSVETGSALSDPAAAERAILSAWRINAGAQLPVDLQPPDWPSAPPGSAIGEALSTWALASSRPLAVFIDEIDSLQGELLLSVLRQIRSGFPGRPRSFPHSLALIGMRDVRDYKLAAGGRAEPHGASPFNIKVESLSLRNFTLEEVAELYQQHTDATGQRFEPAAVARAFELTQGQPWLVNACARQLIEVLVPDRQVAITAADVDRAKDLLIQRQDTHLDSLAERLREGRVKAILEPMLSGKPAADLPPDDLRFVQDLGLIRQSPLGGFEVANPIYKEIIPLALATTTRAFLPQISPSWLKPDGALDLPSLLEAFLDFWRQHGEALLVTAPYHEIAPHLVLMAFLHRVANGSGSVEREYAVGRNRMDLCLRHRDTVLGIELKVWRDGRPDPLAEGLAQLDVYLSGLKTSAGWLVVFDQRSAQPPISDRTTTREVVTPAGRTVVLVRA
jgi:hypothetical protein